MCLPPARLSERALQIRTRNVNLDHICLCHSVSYYEPAAQDPARSTQYHLAVSPLSVQKSAAQAQETYYGVP